MNGLPLSTDQIAAHNARHAEALADDYDGLGRALARRGLDIGAPLVTEIGPSCRICERPACPQRAAAPINRTLLVDEASKAVSPFPFVA